MPNRRHTITLRRPEGGAEHEVTFWTNHNCAAARVYELEDEFENVDLVLFPVGVAGYEMPSGVPFEVVTIAPCGACGTHLRQMFMWSGPKVFVPR